MRVASLKFMDWPERKAQRLKQYDYTQIGSYFVTICVHDQFKKSNIFSKIINHKINLSNIGKIVFASWVDLPNPYNIQLDNFVIMPDHVHGIITILNDLDLHPGMAGNGILNQNKNILTCKTRNGLRPFPTPVSSNQKIHGLPEIVRAFKSYSSRRINESDFKQHFRWQKSFYDRIIRNEKELYAIRQYIKNNPKNADMCDNDIIE